MVATHAEDEFIRTNEGWRRLSATASNSIQLTTQCPGQCWACYHYSCGSLPSMLHNVSSPRSRGHVDARGFQDTLQRLVSSVFNNSIY